MGAWHCRRTSAPTYSRFLCNSIKSQASINSPTTKRYPTLSEYYLLRNPGCEAESSLSISFFLWYLWMVNSKDSCNSDCCLPQNPSCGVESSLLFNFFLWCLRIADSPTLTITIIVGPKNPDCEVQSSPLIYFVLWCLWMVNSTDSYNSDWCFAPTSWLRSWIISAEFF